MSKVFFQWGTPGSWERDLGDWFGDMFRDIGDDVRAGLKRHRRVRFERGDMRYAILSLLDERPMHGYEIIREIERRFDGAYTPSAGTVYPTLQMLEDMDHVSSLQEEGKKVYTITEAGRSFLGERRERVDDIWERREPPQSDARRAELDMLRAEIRLLLHSIRVMGRDAKPEQIQRLRELLVRTRREMEDILRTPVG